MNFIPEDVEKNHTFVLRNLMKDEKHAFLLATHIVNAYVLQMYDSLRKSMRQHDDLFLLIHHESALSARLSLPDDVSCYVFDLDSLNELGYTPIRETLIPGSNHFPVLKFYRHHPGYDFYWNIEYDVVFTGSWKTFFEAYHSLDADFLTCHIRPWREEPGWFWWNTLQTIDPVPVHDLLRSFNPVYRISAQALSFLDQLLQQEGNTGHHEVLLPTLLNKRGYKIVDFGGIGDFVLPGFENRFYTDETMRFRPVFQQPGMEKNKLYHPVKIICET